MNGFMETFNRDWRKTRWTLLRLTLKLSFISKRNIHILQSFNPEYFSGKLKPSYRIRILEFEACFEFNLQKCKHLLLVNSDYNPVFYFTILYLMTARELKRIYLRFALGKIKSFILTKITENVVRCTAN